MTINNDTVSKLWKRRTVTCLTHIKKMFDFMFFIEDLVAGRIKGATINLIIK